MGQLAIKGVDEVVSKLRKYGNDIEKVINISQKKLNNLDELKKSLLQKAFTGELTKSKGIAA